MTINRRDALKRLTAGAVGAAAVAALPGGQPLPRAVAAAQETPSFHGPHQAGIFTPAQRSVVFAAFDIAVSSTAALSRTLQTLTARARFLTTGGEPAAGPITTPPADNGVLGPTIPADRLTITVSVGASMFDARFGLAVRKPRSLTTMGVFPGDALDPAWCHGDMMLQICADNADTAHHALRDIARSTRGDLLVRYRRVGFLSPPRPSGAPRNLMGFKDGTSNPTAAEGADLVWAGAGEPDWAAGGSYQALRFIRMHTEFWDRVSLAEQEAIIGRRRDSGAPLDGVKELDEPDYARDPAGALTPLDAHIRLANPRTAQTASSRILRRPYNYDDGLVPGGDLDAGLLFCAYQQDLRRGFEAVQSRLADDPLNDYIRPFGGGYFFALPGVQSEADWYCRGLLG
jgi:deferrochelatase/peroxidase EfeB